MGGVPFEVFSSSSGASEEVRSKVGNPADFTVQSNPRLRLVSTSRVFPQQLVCDSSFRCNEGCLATDQVGWASRIRRPVHVCIELFWMVLNAISSDFLAKQLKTRAEFFALGLKDPLLWVIGRQWSQALCTEASLPTVVTLL